MDLQLITICQKCWLRHARLAKSIMEVRMDKLIEILKGIRPDIDVNSTTLVDDGFLDSFDIVTLVSEIIDAFGVELSVDDILPENFNSVEAMMNMIEKKR